MKITCLVENTKRREGLGTEHGLSLFIETNKHKILFDMGQSELFEKNAKSLGVELEDVDLAFISHGHYDHGGGLKRFLTINQRAPVYVNHYAFGEHYNGIEKYIGLDKSLQKEERLIFTDDIVVIEEGITLYTKLTVNNYFSPTGELMRKEGVNLLKEDFRHEQYLMLEENGKRVLFSGCSHRGILNIAEEFQPDYLIGGFHFSKLSLDDNLSEYAGLLDRFSIKYYTCHCTGKEQYSFMKPRMKNLFYLSAGEELNI